MKKKKTEEMEYMLPCAYVYGTIEFCRKKVPPVEQQSHGLGPRQLVFATRVEYYLWHCVYCVKVFHAIWNFKRLPFRSGFIYMYSVHYFLYL